MPEVGIRELRDNLSRYISRVREGAEVLVTDHGNAVALIVPLDGVRLVDRLVREGVVSPRRTEPGAVLPNSSDPPGPCLH